MPWEFGIGMSSKSKPKRQETTLYTFSLYFFSPVFFIYLNFVYSFPYINAGKEFFSALSNAVSLLLTLFISHHLMIWLPNWDFSFSPSQKKNYKDSYWHTQSLCVQAPRQFNSNNSTRVNSTPRQFNLFTSTQL